MKATNNFPKTHRISFCLQVCDQCSHFNLGVDNIYSLLSFTNEYKNLLSSNSNRGIREQTFEIRIITEDDEKNGVSNATH